MKCYICGNEDQRYTFIHRESVICRNCISFQSGILEQAFVNRTQGLDPSYTLEFQLSEAQEQLSKELVESVCIEERDVLVYAACGAGKTEIVLELIESSLMQGKVIGIAIPRRQVVLQLHERLSKYFENLSVVAVCEGYTDKVSGDLIICTTHQLFRYQSYFDVLIIDEPDAFPFANNELLHHMMHRSVKGQIVYLSATPTEEMKKECTLQLFRRYHNHDLLVPDVCVSFKIVLFYKLVMYVKKVKKLMLFVPTIRSARVLSKLTGFPCIHSNTYNKEEIIRQFSDDEFKVLICTTIMERGVTFEDVDVCVLFADHQVFTKASLIQIAGRVGRSHLYPLGDGLFLCQKKSKKVVECIEELSMMNA